VPLEKEASGSRRRKQARNAETVSRLIMGRAFGLQNRMQFSILSAESAALCQPGGKPQGILQNRNKGLNARSTDSLPDLPAFGTYFVVDLLLEFL
jgi:hypothetical protein